MPHICIRNWLTIGSGKGLSPVWCQTIAWTNVGLLPIRLLGTNFSEIQIRILSFSFKIMHFKLLFAKMAANLSRVTLVMALRAVLALCCFSHFITLMSNEHHGILHNWQLHCLFYSLLKLKKNEVTVLLSQCKGKPQVISRFPSQTCNYTIMSSVTNPSIHPSYCHLTLF